MTRAAPLANAVLLAYPVLAHLAVVYHSRAMIFAALAVLVVNGLAPWIARPRWWTWPALAVGLVVAAALAWLADGETVLYAAPIVIALAMAWLFGRTLMPGQQPLISRIAAAIRGPLPSVVARYTRAVTLFWTGLMLAMAVENLLLAVYASPVVWSACTNLVNYLLIGAVFLGEWLFRSWALRGHESLTWRGYLRALGRIDYRALMHHD